MIEVRHFRNCCRCAFVCFFCSLLLKYSQVKSKSKSTKILTSSVSFSSLSFPFSTAQPYSPLEADIAMQFKDNKKAFNKKAAEYTREHAS